MRVEDYEYKKNEIECEISEKRKDELLKKIRNQLQKGMIAHHQILKITDNDDELDFIYDWLDKNDIEIRGLNVSISREIENYTHLYSKTGQGFVPEQLDDEEQQRLFLELNNFSEDDKKNNIQAYIDTRNKLIEHNMQLAKWVTSWKWINKINIPTKDKQQMAYLGLIDAVDKFDPTLGYQFSTYACKAIYRAIVREAYREDGNFKQNMIINEQFEMMHEIEDQLLGTLEREPKPYEIANVLGVSIKRVNYLQQLKRLKEKESIEKVDDNIIVDGVYEDQSIPEGLTQRNMVEDSLITNSLKEEVMHALDTLTPRERNILTMRFGLEDGIPFTHDQIARIFNVTRERIKQIEKKGLRKLRHPARAKELKDYYPEDNRNYSEEER